MKKIFIFLLISTSFLFGQSKNADEIINQLKNTFNEVKDYVADVTITTNINFIKVPEMHAKIYFKQPDKVHFESKGFALLPRNGMFTSPLSFLNDDYTAIYVKEDELNGYKTSVVKVIPLNDKGNLILTTLWIDQSKNIIRKVEASTKTNGTFILLLKYGSKMQYPLPDSMLLSFNTPIRRMHLGMHPDMDENSKKNNPDTISGKIIIDYTKYVVNKGIPDSVFTSDQKEDRY